MKFLKPLLLLVFPFSSFVADQPLAFAADQLSSKTECFSHWAIGWYENTSTREKSKEYDGRLTHCSGGEFTADIFEAPNWFSTTNFICHARSSSDEGMCRSTRKLNQTYSWGVIFNSREGDNISPGKVTHHYPYENIRKNRTTCAQANSSVYKYCFKQGKRYFYK